MASIRGAGEEERKSAEVENKKKEAVDSNVMLKWTAFVLNILQATLYFLFMQETQRLGKSYNTSVAVLVQEVLKVLISFAFLSYTEGSVAAASAAVQSAYQNHAMNSVLLLVPGVLYVIQNNLIYIGTGSIGGPETQGLGREIPMQNHQKTLIIPQTILQLKMLTTAVFAMLLLHRRFSLPQWGGLFLLAVGCAMVQVETVTREAPTGEAEPGEVSTPSNLGVTPIFGVLAALVAATTSGAAGISTEMLLKSKGVGLWVRNTQLALWSVVICFILLLLRPEGPTIVSNGFGPGGFFEGFDAMVWFTVLLGSAGGLLIAIILRYLDAVIKNFATAISILLSTTIAVMMRGTGPSFLFLAGVGLVASAVVLYRYAPELPDAAQKPQTIEGANVVREEDMDEDQPPRRN